MATGRSAVTSKPEKEERWSARKKGDAVVRLLRGESLGELSRELRVEGPSPPGMARWGRVLDPQPLD